MGPLTEDGFGFVMHLISLRPFGIVCDHTLFYACKSQNQNIGPHVKRAVSLVIVDGHVIFLRGLFGYVWVNLVTLSPPKGQEDTSNNSEIVKREMGCQLRDYRWPL